MVDRLAFESHRAHWRRGRRRATGRWWAGSEPLGSLVQRIGRPASLAWREEPSGAATAERLDVRA
jgi:hypothetical protein